MILDWDLSFGISFWAFLAVFATATILEWMHMDVSTWGFGAEIGRLTPKLVFLVGKLMINQLIHREWKRRNPRRNPRRNLYIYILYLFIFFKVFFFLLSGGRGIWCPFELPISAREIS